MTRQQDLLEQKLKAQAAIQLFKKSEAYDLLIKPLETAQAKLKNAYDCKTLQEMAELKGKYAGLSFITNLISIYEKEGTLAQEKIVKQKQVDTLDTTDL